MLTVEERLVLHRQLHTLPRSRRYKSAVEHILQHMPAMSASVEAQTLGGLDITRATHENDFQDLSITTLAFCYTSTFAAIDRWIKSILVLARDQQYPTGMRFAGSLSELRAELDALA